VILGNLPSEAPDVRRECSRVEQDPGRHVSP
jgi:hypothetical protein